MDLYRALIALALLFIALTAAPWRTPHGSVASLIAACVCAVLAALLAFGVLHA